MGEDTSSWIRPHLKGLQGIDHTDACFAAIGEILDALAAAPRQDRYLIAKLLQLTPRLRDSLVAGTAVDSGTAIAAPIGQLRGAIDAIEKELRDRERRIEEAEARQQTLSALEAELARKIEARRLAEERLAGIDGEITRMTSAIAAAQEALAPMSGTGEDMRISRARDALDAADADLIRLASEAAASAARIVESLRLQVKDDAELVDAIKARGTSAATGILEMEKALDAARTSIDRLEERLARSLAAEHSTRPAP